VKLLVRERGTEEANDLFLSARRVRSSRVLIPEAHAAVARAWRTGRVGPRAATRSLETASVLLAQIQPIELHRALADSAARLAVDHGLRGYDAVHLASYEQMATRESVLVAADGELVRTAHTLGHAVAVPGS
jgi:predicted nucleic acid-binding protein